MAPALRSRLRRSPGGRTSAGGLLLITAFALLMAPSCHRPHQAPAPGETIDARTFHEAEARFQEAARRLLVVLAVTSPDESHGPYGVGSALALSDRRLLLTQHQIIEGHRIIRAGRDFPTGFSLVCAGAPAGVDWADAAAAGADWAVIELEHSVPDFEIAPTCDWQRPVRPGEVVYLLGYPAGAAPRTTDGKLHLPTSLALIQGFAVRAPRAHESSTNLLFVRVGQEYDVSGGVSGGAAAVFDVDLGRLVVVGIVSGSVALPNGGRNELEPSAVLVVRPPISSSGSL